MALLPSQSELEQDNLLGVLRKSITLNKWESFKRLYFWGAELCQELINSSTTYLQAYWLSSASSELTLEAVFVPIGFREFQNFHTYALWTMCGRVSRIEPSAPHFCVGVNWVMNESLWSWQCLFSFRHAKPPTHFSECVHAILRKYSGAGAGSN